MSNNRKNIFILVALILLVVVGAIIYRSNRFITTSPGDKNNQAGPVVIKVKENISDSSGTYSVEPSINGHLQIVDNYIILWPDKEGGFYINESYVVKFRDYKTISGKSLGDIDFKFKVTETDYSGLQKEVLSKYGRFEVSFNPFLEKLPHKQDLSYRISYSINEHDDHTDFDPNKPHDTNIVELLGDDKNWKEKKDNYVVFIETLVIQSVNDSFETYLEDVRQSRKDALDWIRAQGVDPDKDIAYRFIPDDNTLLNPTTDREEIPTVLDEF